MLRQREIVYRGTVESPRGPAQFVTTEQGLGAVSLPGREPGWLDRWLLTARPGARVVDARDGDPHVRASRDMLAGYFEAGRRVFDLPLDLRGTSCRQAVWREVARIPYGDTRSFGAVASTLGLPARAVGSAIGANPLPILVPSHRVLDRANAINGREAAIVGIHRWLLAHEGLLPADNELPVAWYGRMQRGTGPLYIGTPRTLTYCLPACIAVQERMAWVPRLFRSIAEARAVGFRPCRICQPDRVIRTGPLPA